MSWQTKSSAVGRRKSVMNPQGRRARRRAEWRAFSLETLVKKWRAEENETSNAYVIEIDIKLPERVLMR
jgi:hypothetical protein